MKKLALKKKRVTISLPVDLYAEFRSFADSRSWSDQKAGEQLIQGVFRGTVYSLLTIHKPKGKT